MPKQPDKSAPSSKLSSFELSIMGIALVLFVGFVLMSGGNDTDTLDSEASTQLSYYETDSQDVEHPIPTESGSGQPNVEDSLTKTSTPVSISTKYQTVYVSIDSMKLRSDHNLQSDMISYLRYGEAVENLGEYSVVERIKIAKDRTEVAPWIKVKTKEGKIGWVFGAGLTFYALK